MTRNLKALGMALAAVLAVGAVSASAASASTIDHTFVAHGKYLTLVADPAAPKQVFTFGGAEVTCEELTASGELASDGETEVEEFEVEGTKTYKAPSMTFLPAYNTCTIGGLKATVKANGCHYTLTGKTDAFGHAIKHIFCEAGKQIEISVTGCTVKFGEQTLRGVRYVHEYDQNTQTQNKALTIETTLKANEEEEQTGIQYTATGAFCSLAGIPKEGEDGALAGKHTVTAYFDSEHKEKRGLWTEEKTTP